MIPTLRKNCYTCKHLIDHKSWLTECNHRTGVYVQRIVKGEDGCNTCVSICKAYAPKAPEATKGRK